MSYCKLIVMGYLTRDPELRYLPSGTALVQGCVGVNRKWKSDNGEDKEEVTFIEFTAWARTAEVISQYFKKGDPLFFEGRLRQESWEDKQTGHRRSKLTAVVERFTFIPGRKDRGAPETGREVAPADMPHAERQAAGAGVGGGAPDYSDDVPF